MPSLEIKYSEIFFDPKVQTMCISPSFTCSNYKTSHSCPPVAPYLEIEISSFKKFYLIYSKTNLSEYIKKIKMKHPNRSEFRIKNSFYMKNLYKDDLHKEVDKFLTSVNNNFSETMLLYDGTCRICHNKQDGGCTFDSGKLCRYPNNKRFSMEAVGIEVIGTVYDLKHKDFEYPSKDYEYRFGLVCLR